MEIWDSPEFDAHEQVCFFNDEATGLRAIVAIHSTALGTAAGGTRFKPYASNREAADDALRLSRAMSYKSALAGLSVGGGKAVIVGDPLKLKSRDLLHAYGAFIDRLGGLFSTGEDVGMGMADIDMVSEVTRFVGGTSSGSGDPSVHTAVGVMHGLEAVASHRFGLDGLSGLKVAVQGLGAVGMGVAERLHAAGASLVVADVRDEVVAQAVERFGAEVEPADAIHAAAVDIYCPCALGGVINERSVEEIGAAAVAGAANNQLASQAVGERLAARGILYAPDYVMNAGGIISGITGGSNPARPGRDFAPLDQSLAVIRTRLLDIFVRAEAEGRAPEAIAEALARELIGRAPEALKAA
jgi:leucine dehydrogenase